MSDFIRVNLEIIGFTDNSVIIVAGDIPPSIPKSETYINDPHDESICKLMTDADAEYMGRCTWALFVTAWVPQWVINEYCIKPYVEPAKPAPMVTP